MSTSITTNRLKRAYEICPTIIDPKSNGFKQMKITDHSSKSPLKSVALPAIEASSSSVSSSSSTSTMTSLSTSIVLSSSTVSTISPLFSINDHVQKFAIESFTKAPLDRAQVQEKVRELFIKMAMEMNFKDIQMERDVSIALSLEPSSKAKAVLIMNLAYRNYKNKQWDSAIENCEQGLKLPEMSTFRNALFHYYHGSSLMYRNQKGDLENARAQFEAGLLVKHDDFSLMSDLHLGMSKVLKLLNPSK
jgi:hypothetical protein